MAVSKIWPVRYSLKRVLDYAANPDKTEKKDYSDEQYQALADVLSYAENEEKTEREFYVEGINCNPVEAREQFVMIKHGICSACMGRAVSGRCDYPPEYPSLTLSFRH